MRLVTVWVLSGVLAVSACGGGGGNGGVVGGGGGGGGGDPVVMPPHLSVTARSARTLVFQWNAVPLATHYRLLGDADGENGPQPEQPLADVAADQLTLTTQDVFLPAHVNARYRLQACDDSACADVAQAGIDGIDAGIGYLKASNLAAWDEFGEGLALSPDGRFLAVGAPREDGRNGGIGSLPDRDTNEDADHGAVYVFQRGASGWVQEAYIKPAVAVAGATFGFRLAWSGDNGGLRTLLVGAPEDRSGGLGVNPSSPMPESRGAAYVFERDADGHWTQSATIKPRTSETTTSFGDAVALSLDGQWAAIARPFADAGGAVSIYRRLTGVWAWQVDVQGAHTEDGDGFGEALQMNAAGDVLVVGAQHDDASSTSGTDNLVDAAGAVYVFRRDPVGNVWQPSGYLKSDAIAVRAFFGRSLALSTSGDQLVVGEPGDFTDAGTPGTGRAHLFVWQGGQWLRQTVFDSPASGASGAFGHRVALSGDGSTLAIANPGDTARAFGLTGSPDLGPPIARGGAVWLYRRDGSGAWSAPVYIKAPNTASDTYFGWQLALDDNGRLLAVYGGDASGVPDDPWDTSAWSAGAVYLY